MGACDFIMERDAVTARIGYSELCDEARFEYGNDPYNGTISTTSFCGVKMKITTGNMTKTSQKKALTGARKALDSSFHKWKCYAIDAGIVGYRIEKFEKVPHTKAEAVYRTVYTVYGYTDNTKKSFGSYKTQAEANAKIKQLVAKPDLDYYALKIIKESIKDNKGSDVAIAYERKTRITKSKPKKTPAGAKVTPIHHYVYYGYAGC